MTQNFAFKGRTNLGWLDESPSEWLPPAAHFMGLQTLLVSCSLWQMRAGKDHTDEGPKSGGEKEAVIYWGWRWGH